MDSPSFDKLAIEQLRQRVDARDIARMLLGPGKERGRYDMRRSPFRDDGKNADWAVYGNGHIDYGGDARGDVFDLVKRVKNCTYSEAVNYVQQYAGGASISGSPRTEPKPATGTSEPPSAEWQQAAQAALEAAQDYLWSGKADALQALAYLHQQTLTDDTIRAFGLGFNPKYRKFAGGDLPAGIVIPIQAAGALWRLSVRTNKPAKKYQNATGSKLSGLFNADAIQPGKPVLILEGEKDVMVTQQALGSLATVVTLGGVSSKLSSRWRDVLRLATQVYVSLDNDHPGHDATVALLATLEGWRIKARSITIPAGKDATEYATDHHGDLRAWFEAQTTLKNQAASNILSFEPLPPARQPQSRTGEGWGIGLWMSGVPDSVRSAARNYLHNGVSTIVEVLHRAIQAGLIDPNGFTRFQLENAADMVGFSLSSTGLFNYLQNTLLDEIIQDLGIDSYTENTIPKIGIISKSRTKRENVYQLVRPEAQRRIIESHAYPRFIERFHPTDGDSIIATMYESVVDALDTTEDKNALALELAAVIDASASTQDTRKAKAGIYARKAYERFQKSLNDLHSSTLPKGWEIANESDYIVSFAHSLGTGREGERISLNDWSRLLGISVNSVPTYLKRAGLDKVDQPQFEYVNIDIAENVVKEVNAKAKSLKAYPRWIVVRDQYDNEITSANYDPATAPKIAKQYRILGCKVEVKMQAANAYQVVSESPVEVHKAAVERVASTDPVITPIEPEFEVVRPFREPRLNPAWIAGQFRLVLQQRGRWVEKWRFIDQYGEIVETKEPRALAELIINRHIASNSVHTVIESEMTAGGWRKVSG